MVYYSIFVAMLLTFRIPAEKFIAAKKWPSIPNFLTRVWVVYFAITLNDTIWYLWR